MKKLLLISSFALWGTTLFAQTSNYANGSTVADFTVTDIEGHTHSLYDITSQGKYVVLDFFFTTCGPCQITAPYFNQLHETYGCNSQDLYCLTINNGQSIDNNAAVAAYENTYGGSYAHSPAISNEGNGGPVTDIFGVGAFPTYCLISPDNVMVVNDMWPISSMANFVAFFPANSGIEPAACLVSVSENSNSKSFTAQPVPSTGKVTLDMSGMAPGTADLKVFDLLGQSVLSRKVVITPNGIARHELDLSSLADGQYLCTMTLSNGNRELRRIVIAH
ncbi:MAG: redoxin domain-containing protein [Flavobacteriales bacterium]|nr:redoxin domain-containing protein [Flavobacteriales bacterium]